MPVLLPNPIIQFFDNNGDPLSGGKLYTYSAGTTTPKATYTDSTGTTPLSNPIILDAYGRASIWVDGAYKYSLYTSADVLVKTEDTVSSFNTSSSTIDSLVPSQTGNSGKALITDGATVSWGYPGPSLLAFSDKVINGLKLSNNVTDIVNDIDVASGYCVSDDGTTLMSLSATTKRLDAAWAVGANQGGLDTGSIADTTYHVWVINRPDTNVTDVLFSASVSAPTMPSNYTKKKCIGSIIRVSSALLIFDQFGNEFILRTPVLDVTNAATGTSANTGTLSSVPNGVKVKAIINALTLNNGDYIYISSFDSNDLSPSTSAAPLSIFGQSSGASTAGNCEVWTSTTRTVRYRTNANTTVRIATLGWKDTRI